MPRSEDLTRSLADELSSGLNRMTQVRDATFETALRSCSALSACLGAIGAFMPPTAGAAGTGRRRRNAPGCWNCRRDAVTQLQQAARPGAPADRGSTRASRCQPQSRRIGCRTGSRHRARNNARRTRLDPSLRGELRRAASELTALASGDTRRVASTPVRSWRCSNARASSSKEKSPSG